MKFMLVSNYRSTEANCSKGMWHSLPRNTQAPLNYCPHWLSTLGNTLFTRHSKSLLRRKIRLCKSTMRNDLALSTSQGTNTYILNGPESRKQHLLEGRYSPHPSHKGQLLINDWSWLCLSLFLRHTFCVKLQSLTHKHQRNCCLKKKKPSTFLFLVNDQVQKWSHNDQEKGQPAKSDRHNERRTTAWTAAAELPRQYGKSPLWIYEKINK